MKKYLIILFTVVVAANIPCWAGTLTATGELLIENLVPGKTYHIKEIAKGAYKITNNSELSLRVTVAPILPDKQLMRKGFDPMPRIGWVTIEPGELLLEPGKAVCPDVIIKLPNSAKIRGKKFQFHVWSKTLPVSGRGFNVSSGIESVFLVTIAK